MIKVIMCHVNKSSTPVIICIMLHLCMQPLNPPHKHTNSVCALQLEAERGIKTLNYRDSSQVYNKKLIYYAKFVFSKDVVNAIQS